VRSRSSSSFGRCDALCVMGGDINFTAALDQIESHAVQFFLRKASMDSASVTSGTSSLARPTRRPLDHTRR
jgi:hypothetical protein